MHVFFYCLLFCEKSRSKLDLVPDRGAISAFSKMRRMNEQLRYRSHEPGAPGLGNSLKTANPYEIKSYLALGD